MTNRLKNGKKSFSRDLILDQSGFREIISGKQSRPGAILLRCGLSVASVGYGAVVYLRNRLYDTASLKEHKANAPVISVGNITAGGTGKTPLVAWIAKQLSAKYSCAIITRGYKAAESGSEEANMLAGACENVPVIINPDRVAGADEAVRFHGAQVLILDDAFQHRKLARDIDIVTIDATCPFGYNRILPAGLLREPVSSLKRADIAIITRSDQVREYKIADIEKQLLKTNPKLLIGRAVHKPVELHDAHGKDLQMNYLNEKKVFAFCGIGNPEAFFQTLRDLGVELVGRKAFDDHHHYSEQDIKDVCYQAQQAGAELMATTEKDWAKLEIDYPGLSTFKTVILKVAIELTGGGDNITRLIEQRIASKIT